MARIYSNTNRIRFTDIPEKYAVPRAYRGKQCEVHSAVVTYVFDNFQNTKKYRQKVVDALNTLTYCLLNNDPPPYKWNSANPLETMPSDFDMAEVEESLGHLFLTDEAIEWDVTPVSHSNKSVTASAANSISSKEENGKSHPMTASSTAPSKKQKAPANRPLKEVRRKQKEESATICPTPKEDLYIQSPKYPRFDTSKVWMHATDGGDQLTIYTTLPEIPTKQNEISVTTNLDIMTETELIALYPNHIIHTRSPKMYEKQEGIDFDEELGSIIPIEGFTRAQVVDNIICYPHIYKLKKLDEFGSVVSFYSTIEVDGELLPIEEAWNTLPEASVIPKEPEFVKEYVVRRYLLEEASGMEHKFKMYGTLDPFLTLFMPPGEYIKRGYKDTTSIAKQCVQSRIRYKQSRNPILRRLNNNA